MISAVFKTNDVLYSKFSSLTYGRFHRPFTQSSLRGSKKLILIFFFSSGHPQQKVLKDQVFSGMMVCLENFLVKGKKEQGRGRRAPSPIGQGAND